MTRKHTVLLYTSLLVVWLALLLIVTVADRAWKKQLQRAYDQGRMSVPSTREICTEHA